MRRNISGKILAIYLSTIFFSSFILSCAARKGVLIPSTQPSIPASQSVQPGIRVLVKKGLERVVVDPGRYTMESIGGTGISRGEGTVRIEVRGNMLAINGGKRYAAVRMASPQPVNIDGTAYSRKVIFYPMDGSIAVVDIIGLEEYVRAVLRQEVPDRFNFEAKKAVAVAIRTYALFRKEKSKGEYYDLDSSNLSQVYEGTGGKQDDNINAVLETEGEIMIYHNEPILSVYHSTCGGRTENSQDIWHKDLPYLRSVSCGFCVDSPSYRWEFSTGEDSFLDLLYNSGVRGSRIVSLDTGTYTGTGRVLSIFIQTDRGRWKIDTPKLRSIIGYSRFKSLRFVIQRRGQELIFRGRGYGHGVGLCQYGANGMAEKGYGYRDILHHYYGESVEISSVY